MRYIIELTLAGEDPNTEGLERALVNSRDFPCEDLTIRQAEGITDVDEDWRTVRYDFSTFFPGMGRIMGLKYPVPAVDPLALARVWEILSRAEAGEFNHRNIEIAVGQVIGAEGDANAIIARVAILRHLQDRGAVVRGASVTTFEAAATFPLESAADPEAFAAHFNSL